MKISAAMSEPEII